MSRDARLAWSAVAAATVALFVAAVMVVPRAGAGTPVHVEASPADAARPADPAPPSRQERALARWADFPADADPRPLVILGPVRGGPEFATDVEWAAFTSRRWDLPRHLPNAPARYRGYPISAPSAALAELRGGDPLNYGAGRRVEVTSVRLGLREFVTDRGKQTLPAWLVSFRGSTYPKTIGPAVVPAVAAPARYLPKGTASSGLGPDSLHVAADGRTVTARFTGECAVAYRADVVETSSAIGVEVSEVRHPTAAEYARRGCADVGYDRKLTFRLAAPVGGRVLVDTGRGGARPATGPGARR